MLAKLDHPVIFVILNSAVTFGIILGIVYVMVRAGLGNPIAIAAGEA